MNKQITFGVYLVTGIIFIVSLIAGEIPIAAVAAAFGGLFAIYKANYKK